MDVRFLPVIALLVACGPDPAVPPDVPTSEGIDTTEVVTIPPVTGTVDSTITPPPAPSDQCYAEYVFDRFADGSINGVGLDVYDDVDAARIVSSLRTWSASAGEVDALTTFTYDALDQLVAVEVDEELDGDLDEITTYAWDAGGRLAAELRDLDGDGHADEADMYTYDPSGVMIGADHDFDGDGSVDLSWTYTLDAVGRPILEEGDQGDNGTIDRRNILTYTDPVLWIGTAEDDDDNDGDVDATRTFEYDAANRPLLLQEDRGQDGLLDLDIRVTWVDGAMITYDLTFRPPPPDNSYLFWVGDAYEYDGSGRKIRHQHDLAQLEPDPLDGFPDREQWTFGGTCP